MVRYPAAEPNIDGFWNRFQHSGARKKEDGEVPSFSDRLHDEEEGQVLFESLSRSLRDRGSASGFWTNDGKLFPACQKGFVLIDEKGCSTEAEIIGDSEILVARPKKSDL